MRSSRPVTRLFAGVLLVLLAAACSSAPSAPSGSAAPASRGPTPSPSPIALTDYPSGFPTVYTNEVDPAPNLLEPVPGGLRHAATGTLRADDGTTGTYTATWIENRVRAATIECGGRTYSGRFTADAPAITMEVTFPEWGHAILVASDRIVVFHSSNNGSSPAACDEVYGGTFTFEFTSGPIKQLMSGTWTWDEAGRLIFDSALASASPSASESPG